MRRMYPQVVSPGSVPGFCPRRDEEERGSQDWEAERQWLFASLKAIIPPSGKGHLALCASPTNERLIGHFGGEESLRPNSSAICTCL
jgi:hypothetical protein